ncbi:MAG: vitamin K epoxide reductase family protein [Bacteroidota bacterium]|nr:vitamin K epoxide reductase family protein [Bacteroidota bacterium]
MHDDYISSLLQEFLKKQGVKARRTEISLIHNSDPHLPSAFSIIQTLRYFNIKAVAYKTDFSTLKDQQGSSFILHFTINDGVFVLLKTINHDFVRVFDYQKNQTIKLSINQFLQLWSGIVIKSNNELSVKKRPTKSLHFFIFLIIAITLLTRLFLVDNVICFATLLNIVGIYLSVNTLIIKEGSSNEFIVNYCNINKEKTCSSIITSNVSLLGININLSELSVFYFSFNLIYLILFGITNIHFNVVLIYIGALGLPFILISLYYQLFKLRAFCTICLSIFIVYLLINTLLVFFLKDNFINVLSYIPDILYHFIISLGIAFLFVKSSRFVINCREKYKKNALSEQLLKRNPEIRNVAFSIEKRIELDNISICIGKSEVKNEITSVLSLHCKYCKEVALQIIKMVSKFSEDLKWNICLISSNDKDDFSETLELLLMCQKWPGKQLEIIKDWYTLKNIEILREKYFTSTSNKALEQKILHSNKELQQKGIAKVPLTILNGKEYSRFYNLQQDLELLLIDLTEN